METKRSHEYWTIADVCALAASVLSVDCPKPTSGRGRDALDPRTFRYYTTLGLIDRPTAWRWRTALYERRHLLQLVAIKRLQTQGQTLTEIQEELLGKPTAALEKIAQLPPSIGDGPPPRSPSTTTANDEQRSEEFWREVPEPSRVKSAQERIRKKRTPDLGQVIPSEREAEPSAQEESGGILDQHPPVFLGVPLTADVTLAFAPRRPLTTTDLQAIQATAGSLLELLKQRQLL